MNGSDLTETEGSKALLFFDSDGCVLPALIVYNPGTIISQGGLISRILI